MNQAIQALLTTLLNQRIIGGKHTVEHRIIKSKTKYLGKQERKEFSKEYKELVKEGIIIRAKKRTGKGYDWHISLNAKKVREVIRWLT
ncbi:hypothetical protein KY348_03055 [Candidatus Woesearchaeota archaeon]|nr:hypothetical protein [Candidatus Woesearchaeota archaeon]